MKIGCESLTGNHDDPGQSGREDLNLRLQGSESRVLRPFCRVPPDGSRNVSTASSATDQALRLPTPETDRRGDLPGFLGRELLPHPKRCGEPGSWKTQWLRVPTPAGAGAPGAPLRAGEGVPCQDAARPDIVKAVANRVGITKAVSPQVLRHTFATMALRKGISLPTVQKILGHDSLQTTAIYLNFTDVHIQDEFERKW